MASAAGGVEIEEVARTNPEKIIKVHIDPFLGFAIIKHVILPSGLTCQRSTGNSSVRSAADFGRPMSIVMQLLVEINPLVILKEKSLMALDGKMLLDDNALFRHSDLAEMRDVDEEAACRNRGAQIWTFLY